MTRARREWVSGQDSPCLNLIQSPSSSLILLPYSTCHFDFEHRWDQLIAYHSAHDINRNLFTGPDNRVIAHRQCLWWLHHRRWSIASLWDYWSASKLRFHHFASMCSKEREWIPFTNCGSHCAAVCQSWLLILARGRQYPATWVACFWSSSEPWRDQIHELAHVSNVQLLLFPLQHLLIQISLLPFKIRQ